MSNARILARLPVPLGGDEFVELILADRSARGRPFVCFETSFYHPDQGDHSHVRTYMGDRALRDDVLRAATSDYIARYLRIVVDTFFKGHARPAVAWMFSELHRELTRIRS